MQGVSGGSVRRNDSPKTEPARLKCGQVLFAETIRPYEPSTDCSPKGSAFGTAMPLFSPAGLMKVWSEMEPRSVTSGVSQVMFASSDGRSPGLRRSCRHPSDASRPLGSY
jgi:hypothetical protein